MNDDVLDEYARWMRSWGASESTVRQRLICVSARLKEWGVDGFTEHNIEGFLGRPELAQWSRATYHAHLKSFCDWLEATGRVTGNPMASMRKGKRPPPSPRPLSEAEVNLVLERASGRERDWFLLALHAGLRAHEIAKIRGQDVSPDGIYVEGKGGSRYTLPTHDDLWAMAQRYPRAGYWFPSRKGTSGHVTAATVTNRVSELFKTLGIGGSVHRARHTYGTRLLRAGVNIRKVQKLMRHMNLETTATYTAVDEDELRAAINLLPSAS
jgi:integrase/recombinase XerD